MEPPKKKQIIVTRSKTQVVRAPGAAGPGGMPPAGSVQFTPIARSEKDTTAEDQQAAPAPGAPAVHAPTQDAARRSRVAQLAGETAKKKQDMLDQENAYKANVKTTYRAAKDAYRAARSDYNQIRPPITRFFRVAGLTIYGIFWIVALVCICVAVYAVFQAQIENLAGQESSSAMAMRARALRASVQTQVASTSGGLKQFMGWASWVQREKDLVAVIGEKQAVEEQLGVASNDLQTAKKNADDLTARLADQEKTTAKTQETLNDTQAKLKQSQEEVANLQTAKKETEAKVEEKEASIQKALADQKKLQKSIDDMRVINGKLADQLRNFTESPAPASQPPPAPKKK